MRRRKWPGRRPRLPTADEILESFDAALGIVHEIIPAEVEPEVEPEPEVERAQRERMYPRFIGARVNDEEQALIDAAALLSELTRAHFVREVTLSAAHAVVARQVIKAGT